MSTCLYRLGSSRGAIPVKREHMQNSQAAQQLLRQRQASARVRCILYHKILCVCANADSVQLLPVITILWEAITHSIGKRVAKVLLLMYRPITDTNLIMFKFVDLLNTLWLLQAEANISSTVSEAQAYARKRFPNDPRAAEAFAREMLKSPFDDWIRTLPQPVCRLKDSCVPVDVWSSEERRGNMGTVDLRSTHIVIYMV